MVKEQYEKFEEETGFYLIVCGWNKDDCIEEYPESQELIELIFNEFGEEISNRRINFISSFNGDPSESLEESWNLELEEEIKERTFRMIK